MCKDNNELDDIIDSNINRLKQGNNKDVFNIVHLILNRIMRYSVFELFILFVCYLVSLFYSKVSLKSLLVGFFGFNAIITIIGILVAIVVSRTDRNSEEFKKSFDLKFDILVIILALIIGILFRFVLLNGYIPSGSMSNTLLEGDIFLGNRLAYVNSEPKRYDIVAFKCPDNEKELFIKRIIGLPGERVIIKDGKVYIDGIEEPLLDDFIREPMITQGEQVYDVPNGYYFMLGDNRNFSNDSRYWEHKYVADDKIVAKAVFKYVPKFIVLN